MNETLELEIATATSLIRQQASQIEKLQMRIDELETGIAKRAELGKADSEALIRIKARLAAERRRAERAEAAERALFRSIYQEA